MPDGRTVVIWRSCLLPGSETFVRQHGAALTRWRAAYLGAVRVDSPLTDHTDTIVWPDGRRGRWAYLLLRLTGRSAALRGRLAETGPALVHAHFGGDARLVSGSAARLGLPLVVTLHGLDVTRQARRPGLRGARHRRNLRTAFGRAGLVLAVSDAIRRHAIALGADPHRVRVHHTGVPIPAEVPATAVWDVTFVGRFVEKKGVDDLVEALGLLADLRPRVLFIGAGPLEAPARQRAATLGLDATFLGMQEPAVVGRHLAASKILAAPSRTAADGDSEGLPTTILEAGARGVPAVSTTHSGIPEAVVHGETGLLGEPGDRPALAANLRRLLTDDALRRRLGHQARRHVRTHFDLATQSLLLEELYDALLAGTLHQQASALRAGVPHHDPDPAPGCPDPTDERHAQPGRSRPAE